MKARIFVPEISSAAKVEAIRRFGAEVVIGGARYDDAQAACDAYVAESGAARIHPFSALPTIAGQGTLALEWAEQAELDTVLIAVGGGGLISGVASAFAGTGVKVVGVEPQGSRALHAALEAGKPVDVSVESVAADSLGARNVGELVHSICRDHVPKWCWCRMRRSSRRCLGSGATGASHRAGWRQRSRPCWPGPIVPPAASAWESCSAAAMSI